MSVWPSLPFVIKCWPLRFLCIRIRAELGHTLMEFGLSWNSPSSYEWTIFHAFGLLKLGAFDAMLVYPEVPPPIPFASPLEPPHVLRRCLGLAACYAEVSNAKNYSVRISNARTFFLLDVLVFWCIQIYFYVQFLLVSLKKNDILPLLWWFISQRSFFCSF